MNQASGNEIRASVVVGIGASAGGVEALSLFFDSERGGSGAAFVVLMHLSGDRPSHLPDILARHTGMPVLKIEDGMALEPDKVYVMPPGVLLTIDDGHLRLRKPDITDRVPTVIDRFFNSLAEQYGHCAIGIVLSGTGADGALGLKAIKERGGLTLAQGEDGTAPLFAGMPESAVAVGAIDLQLSVEEMGPRLASAIADMQVADDASQGKEGKRAEKLRLEIAGLLHAQLNHDFSGYKPSTFMRRVHRRVNVLQLANLEAYVDYLGATPAEAHLLFCDLLISVTSFFRDDEAFSAIETYVIPELFKGKRAAGEVRVWVPGCATGEESYSLAMLLLEYADGLGKDAPNIRVFASDIDEHALSIGRRGRYPSVLVDAVSPERRSRFFIDDGGSWSVQKRLREVCTFSSHNVLRDPPFSRINLVSCRNLLIYLGPDFQDRILPILHCALRPDGFLFVGVAEGAARHSNLFAPLSKAHRIFRKLPTAPDRSALPMLSGRTPRRTEMSTGPGTSATHRAGNAMRRRIETRILQAHTPPYVLVNAAGDALFYSGRTGSYLEFSPGAPSRHLLSNARKELRLGLRRALHDAVQTHDRVDLPAVDVLQEHGVRRVQMSIEPFEDGDNPLFLVLFNDRGPAPERTFDPDDANARTVEQLERELRDAREHLQSTYEEFETAIEELRVSNEELMSVNEEL
ncbi:MAG: chemotaxis protein CheB, partial [Rhodanobacter sp.]